MCEYGFVYECSACGEQESCQIGGTGLVGGCEPPDGVLGIELVSSRIVRILTTLI